MDTSVSTQTIDPEPRLAVVVGVLVNPNGKYLVQQRPAGKPCPGKWEFPGGKIESGETDREALAREIFEELGVMISDCMLLMEHNHDYDHARVTLKVYLVERYQGDPTPREGQVISWGGIEEIREMDVLEAVYPILGAMAAD